MIIDAVTRLILDPTSNMRKELFAIIAVSVTAGIIVAFRSYRKNWKKEAIVNSSGISVMRDGHILNQCTWPEMTISAAGKGWRKQLSLCDQFGIPFDFSAMESKHEDARLVRLIVRTMLRRTKANIAQEAKRRPWSWWILVPIIAMGLATFPLMRLASLQFIERVGDPTSAPISRLSSLAILISCGLVVAASVVAMQMSQVPFMAYVKRKTQRKNSELTKFIADRKGTLTAVDMADGDTYAYVVPDQLKKQEQSLSEGIMLIVIAALFVAGLVSILIFPTRQENSPAVGIVCCSLLGLILGPLGIASLRQGIRLRRLLHCQFRRAGNHILVIHPNGTQELCDVTRAPSINRSSKTRLGALSWTLQCERNRTYLIDLRYLLPVSDGLTC